VIDRGEGVPQELREKIFERFYRIDNSRNRETGGSGLGLAIAKSIIDAHGGKIWLEETPGGGATFIFEISK
jgi:two-component system OmpR family sensor kinase